ncbi:MAG: hypothetical protein A2583_11390 [Bdellovibrionales bacterium RIFOXYD1_FULL_53_11]|nr:MAG: hypothetical protein A2583_11390 [Bdellovibrionales bacterium RIFOXYD1_FULL_53_11]
MENERKFLHDISSPAGTVLLLLESLQDELREKSVSAAAGMEMLEKAIATVRTMHQLIAKRREILVANGARND